MAAHKSPKSPNVRRPRGAASPDRSIAALTNPDVIRWRIEGWSFTEIGNELGITRQAARERYWTARKQLQDTTASAIEEIEEKKDNQVARMEALIKAWLPLAVGKHKDPDTGLPVLNKDAAAVVLKAEERLARLIGLDAPAKTDITSGGARVSNGVTPADLVNLSAEELAQLEALYSRAGVLKLPNADDQGGEVIDV